MSLSRSDTSRLAEMRSERDLAFPLIVLIVNFDSLCADNSKASYTGRYSRIPGMSERTTRSHRKTANAGNVSTVPVTNEADAQPPSTKRARTQKGKKLAAHSSRKRGRLSVLPSLPLDVLFEVNHSVDIMR